MVSETKLEPVASGYQYLEMNAYHLTQNKE